MKKKNSAVLLFITIIFLLSACNQGAKSGEASKKAVEKTVLKVYYWDEVFKNSMDKIQNDFMAANPDIVIENTVIPFAQYWTKLQTTLNSPSGPDVFWLNYMYSLEFGPKGLLTEVTSIDRSKYPDAALNMFTYNGKLYAVPFMVDTIALYYNKKLFDAAKEPYPSNDWTWKDMRTAAKRLTIKDAAGNTKQFGVLVQLGSQSGAFNFFLQNGVTIYNQDKATPNFNTPAGYEAVQFMYDLMYVDGSAPTGAQVQEVNVDDRFMAGQAAMTYSANPRLARYVDALGPVVGVAELPAGKQDANNMNVCSFAGSAASANPEGVKRFLAFCATRQAQEAMALNALPAYEGTGQQWLDRFPGSNADVFVKVQKDAYPMPLTLKNAGNTRKILETELANILMKEKSVKQGLDEAAAKIIEETK